MTWAHDELERTTSALRDCRTWVIADRHILPGRPEWVYAEERAMARWTGRIAAVAALIAGLTWATGLSDRPGAGSLDESQWLRVTSQAHAGSASTSSSPGAERAQGVRAAEKLAQPQGATSDAGVIGLTPTPAGRWGVIEHGNGVRTEVDHDGAGRISAVRHLYGATVVALISYSFDANGNRLSETIEAQGQSWETTYQYDRSDRLVGYTSPEGAVSYTLDGVGNRVQTDSDGIITTHVFDSRDRLTEVKNAAGVILASYGYDEAGRQTSRTDHQSGTTTYYSYNAHDRLIAIRQGSPAAEPLVRYEYNSRGQRTARIDASSREHYQWDGVKLTVRTNMLGNPLGHYTSASGWTLASTEGTESYAHHTDGLGTPVALTDPQAGLAVRYRFDPWGVPIEQTKPHLNPIGFTGYLRDTATDQLYAKARQYEPGVGRFTSVDPWDGDPLNPISLHHYLYGFGNPGVYIDPDGRCGIMSSVPSLSGICGFVESRMLGIDLGTAVGQQQLADYRSGTRQGALRTVVETAVGAAQLFADISVAGRERLTGENFGASDRVGAVVSGMVDTASDLPGSVATYAADREEAIRGAHASGDFHELGDYVARTQLEVGSAVTGTVGGTRAAVGMAGRMTPSPSRPVVVSESQFHAGPRFDVDGEAGLGQIEHPTLARGGSTYQERLNQTPVHGGWWSGARGESTFYSSDSKVQSSTMDRGVVYANARPDFSPYTAAEVEIANMTTNRRANFMQADQEIAQQMGVSRREVTQWREQNGYTWHEDSTTRMQLVPTEVNLKHGHLGGVGEIKRQHR